MSDGRIAVTAARPVARAAGWIPVWRRNVLVWRKLLGPAILGNFGEPVLYLVALGYGLGALVGEIGGMRYVVFLASGFVASSAMVTASFEGMYSAYTRMAVQRTWDAMLATPLDVPDIVLGECIWAATKSLMSGAAILCVAAALGAVAGWTALVALPVVFLTGLCFAALALVVTAYASNYDFFLYYNTLLLTPMLLLGDVFFPLEQMPGAVQAGAMVLPLAHAVALVRPLMTGQPLDQPLLHLAVIAAYGTCGLTLAVRLIRRRLLV